MKLIVALVAIFVYGLCNDVRAYKPVVFMHGILAGASEANSLFTWIQQNHTGTVTLSIRMYEDLESLKNMMTQVKKISYVMTEFMNSHPDGIHLICFSQGGLVCRGLLEHLRHNVDTFISLSSPQAGQFGDTDYLKFVLPKVLRDNAYKFLYTKDGQKVSVGNYWNDPHHQDLYLKFSKFLAVINNETANARSQEFKANFLRLKKLVMIGGPNDGVITPWQSSHFGFYDSKLNIVEMNQTKWYRYDSFGLQTMHKKGDVITHVIPGVKHTHWYSTYSVYEKCILPYLT